jgi:hypothetical protein
VKTLVGLWPWYSFALLFLNIALALATVLLLWHRISFLRLSTLRFYLWYSIAAGVAGLVVAALTPIGKMYYWHFMIGADIGFDLVTFLLCAQVVDQLIRRDDPLRVKRLSLLGLPVAFLIGVIANNMHPGRSVAGLLAFDSLAMLLAGFVIVAIFVTPAEDWIRGYGLVVAGLGWQIVSTASMNLVYQFFHSRWVDIVGPSSSAVTVGIFLIAAARRPLD